MTPEKFSIAINEKIVKENIALYKDLFVNSQIDNIKDPQWIESIIFFTNLDESEKDIFFKIIRQTIIDTTSNLLGILDGSSYIEGMDDDFLLTYGESKNKINGNLQDVFLEICEKSLKY